MSLLQGVVLGAVQGLTEFLPVSSSGHLILVPKLFGWPDQGLAFDTVLHGGTLLAVLWFFRQDLVTLIRGLWAPVVKTRTSARRFVLQLIVAAMPGLLIGYLLNDFLARYDRVAWLVAFDLALWAIVLGWADRRARNSASVEELEPLTWKQAILIGLAQVFALLPGTSRSGMTITAGLFLGLSRARAARFSFLLSIPMTGAAAAFGVLQWVRHPVYDASITVLAIGFLMALLMGAWSIRFLLRFVSHRSYAPFVFYRLALACLVLLLLLR